MKKVAMIFLKALGGIVALILLAIVALNIYLSTRPAAKTMKAAGIISIPTPFRVGRAFIDYMTISGSRLYAGYASHGLVGVVDTATNGSVATIDGLTRVHGIAVVADRNLGFASSSGDNLVGVFDLTSNKLLQKIPGGDDPDAIIYDEQAHLVYVANHNGKTGMLIDPATSESGCHDSARRRARISPGRSRDRPDLSKPRRHQRTCGDRSGETSRGQALQTRSRRWPHRPGPRRRSPSPLQFHGQQEADRDGHGNGSDCRSSPHRRGCRWRGIRSRPAPRLHGKRHRDDDRHSAGFPGSVPCSRECPDAFWRAFARRGPGHSPRLRGLLRIDRRVRSRALNETGPAFRDWEANVEARVRWFAGVFAADSGTSPARTVT